MPTPTSETFERARLEFGALVAEVRPELHRYCARLTGSIIDGEDIVQEALAKAFYALSMSPVVPALRPWLFRIAHNAALDFLKSHGRRYTDPHAEMDALAGAYDAADVVVVRFAFAGFLLLPLRQRSAVILMDVLGHSLAETAETMGTTVMAVKAALVRGRAALRAQRAHEEVMPVPTAPDDLDRYAALFNARDWDALRAMIGDDCRLDLVSRSQRRGAQVGLYFDNYARLDVRLRVALVEGRFALAAYVGAAPTPTYFILMEVSAGRIRTIRDYHYVPYIIGEAHVVSPTDRDRDPALARDRDG